MDCKWSDSPRYLLIQVDQFCGRMLNLKDLGELIKPQAYQFNVKIVFVKVHVLCLIARQYQKVAQVIWDSLRMQPCFL
jgi:hypothetical protein